MDNHNGVDQQLRREQVFLLAQHGFRPQAIARILQESLRDALPIDSVRQHWRALRRCGKLDTLPKGRSRLTEQLRLVVILMDPNGPTKIKGNVCATISLFKVENEIGPPGAHYFTHIANLRGEVCTMAQLCEELVWPGQVPKQLGHRVASRKPLNVHRLFENVVTESIVDGILNRKGADTQKTDRARLNALFNRVHRSAIAALRKEIRPDDSFESLRQLDALTKQIPFQVEEKTARWIARLREQAHIAELEGCSPAPVCLSWRATNRAWQMRLEAFADARATLETKVPSLAVIPRCTRMWLLKSRYVDRQAITLRDPFLAFLKRTIERDGEWIVIRRSMLKHRLPSRFLLEPLCVLHLPWRLRQKLETQRRWGVADVATVHPMLMGQQLGLTKEEASQLQEALAAHLSNATDLNVRGPDRERALDIAKAFAQLFDPSCIE